MGTRAFTPRTVRRDDGRVEEDQLAVEEPLEIRVGGDTVAITMRTPGEDVALTLGFLFSEGVIRGPEDVGAVAHCGRPGEEGYGNVIELTPAPGAHLVLRRLDAVRRGPLTTSACGVCGRLTIEDLLEAAGPVPEGPQLAPSLVEAGLTALRARQPTFDRTGGLHGAVLLDSGGQVLSAAEDVGRHNAVDKALGAVLQRGALPARRRHGAPAVLVVSGRASFEIVQKAVAARLAAVFSVSAASSLAVDLAASAGLTLVSFCRPPRYTVMVDPGRLAHGPGSAG